MISEIILPKNVKIETVNTIKYFIQLIEEVKYLLNEKEINDLIILFIELDKTTYPIGKRGKKYCFYLILYYIENIKNKKSDKELRLFWSDIFEYKIFREGYLDKNLNEIRNILILKKEIMD